MYKNIAVYCGAHNGTNQNINNQLHSFGVQMATNNIGLVFGAGGTGLMGIVGTAVRDNGGNTYGVVPEFLKEFEPPLVGIDELHIVDTMHTRKQMMFYKADAFVIFPGGLGSMDELFEILTWKKLKRHSKPIIVVNIDNYYNHILSHIDHIISQQFSSPSTNDLFDVVQNGADVLNILHSK